MGGHARAAREVGDRRELSRPGADSARGRAGLAGSALWLRMGTWVRHAQFVALCRALARARRVCNCGRYEARRNRRAVIRDCGAA